MGFEEFKDVVDMSLCDSKYMLWNNIYEEEKFIANLSQESYLGPELKLEKEEQRIGLLLVIVYFFLIILFFFMHLFL